MWSCRLCIVCRIVVCRKINIPTFWVCQSVGARFPPWVGGGNSPLVENPWTRVYIKYITDINGILESNGGDSEELFFWRGTSCSLIEDFRRFGRAVCLLVLLFDPQDVGRHYISLKRRQISTRLDGVICQKTVIFIRYKWTELQQSTRVRTYAIILVCFCSLVIKIVQ
jgi:hypothetical protein